MARRKQAEWPVLTHYGQDHLARIALPLGGIGTGTVSLGGRGNLRDWEIMDFPAKGFTPNGCLFALYAKPEGFRLKSVGKDTVTVIGADPSGVLYGCLELAERIRVAQAIPAVLDLTDAPEFKLRGPCIGMQRLGGSYMWPYKPETFPFFYDKDHWREYLDFLVGIRMNSLYLWNGHPFSSLVQLDDYPDAAEVSHETLNDHGVGRRSRPSRPVLS